MGSGGSEWNDGLPELVGHAGRVAGLVDGEPTHVPDEFRDAVVAFQSEPPDPV